MAAKHRYSIILFIVFITGLLIRYFMIQLDPYLHHWDEHFHALVAKNMLEHPFKPTMIEYPIIPYKVSCWNGNYVWLHKPPLFLWQMAISLKFLGCTEVAVRMPSLIMTSLSILLLYRITFLTTGNNKTALLAGILMCFSYYQFQLISGRYSTDHNDVAFGFYVLASIWAYMEYLKKLTWKWVILVGLFAGCAILNKWLTGLLVYSAWGIQASLDYYSKREKRNIVRLIVSIVVCAAVFVPWQIYIYRAFPVEARFENDFNNRHLWEALEENTGSVFFYLAHYDEYYGLLTSLLFLFGILAKKSKSFNKQIGNTLLTFFFIVLFFFSFLVKTKMMSFIYCVLPIGYVFAAVALERLYQMIGNKWIFSAVLVIILINTARPYDVWKATRHSASRNKKIANTKILKTADEIVPPNINVVMNLGNDENIDLMFYNKRKITAYPGFISEENMNLLEKTKTPVAVFMSHGKYVLPPYVTAYPYLYIIPQLLKDPD